MFVYLDPAAAARVGTIQVLRVHAVLLVLNQERLGELGLATQHLVNAILRVHRVMEREYFSLI